MLKLEKKRLLIITQKVDENDDLLGFFHGWINEFAKQCKSVTVIALSVGKYNLPKNVKVFSLGKEKFLPLPEGEYGEAGRGRETLPEGESREAGRGREFIPTKNSYALRVMRYAKKLTYTLNFYKHIYQERKNYDTVFVHMNQIYIILGGLFWKLTGKKIFLWYAHGYVPLGLKVAEKFTENIFTSTKSGCRLNSKKIQVVGQGIDVAKFMEHGTHNMEQGNTFNILSVGRISPVKDYETLIDAIEILKDEKIKVKIIGKSGTDEQVKYFVKLKSIVYKKGLEDKIKFLGSIPNKEIVKYYNESNLYINNSLTGSLDKTILEAMASEKIILSCNESLIEVLGEYKKDLMFEKKNAKELSEKIKWAMSLSKEQKQKIGTDLRKIVKQRHSVERLVEKLLNIIYS